MTPAEKEAYYDEHIAPVLRQLSQTCQANGLNMLALVEWEKEKYGRTLALDTRNAGNTIVSCNDLAKKGFISFAVEQSGRVHKV